MTSLRLQPRTVPRKTTFEVMAVVKEVRYAGFRARHPFPQSAAVVVERRRGVRIRDASRVPSAVVEEVEAAAASPVVRGAVVRAPTDGKLKCTRQSESALSAQELPFEFTKDR